MRADGCLEKQPEIYGGSPLGIPAYIKKQKTGRWLTIKKDEGE